MTTNTELQLTDTDDRTIRDLVQRAHDAQNDPVALPEMHDETAVIVNIAGRRLFGRDEFISAMAGALASPLRDVTTTVETIDVRAVTADVAIVSSTKSVHDGRPEAGDALPQRGAFTYVVVRREGEWRIALAQTTPIVGGD